jgi:predicted O-methyltransferase YrrM
MSGTAYTKIDKTLGASVSYIAFRHGEISVALYQKWAEGEGSISMPSLNEDQINLSARFPRDKHDFVRRALAQCRALDIITNDHYDAQSADQTLANVDAKYDHGGHLTYIFPEENALLYAIVQNVRPRRAACMGSYYGYWAAAAKAAQPDMSITLLDVNPTVMDLAQKNFELLGLAHDADFVVGNAENLASSLGNIDLLILDAEGPKSEDIPVDYRDKAIYYPLLKSALDNLVPGALVIAHNVILANFTDGSYFEEKQRNYREQYAKFLPLLQDHFLYTVIDSTEGVLVARKRC